MARYGWNYDRPGGSGLDRYNPGYRDAGYPGRVGPAAGYGARDYGYGARDGFGYGARDGFGYGARDGHGARDRDYGTGAYRYGADYGPAYDRDYKSQARTDFGDPFGDRSRGVPFRVKQGEFHARDRGGAGMHGYDRGFRGHHGNRYDRGGW